MWYLYIAEFNKGKYYTGITTNPKRRIDEHNNGIGAKSLRGKGPIKLVYCETQLDKLTAIKREREIKGWSHEKKRKLMQG